MEPGDVVANRFELEELAGSGGMGLVYRARDRVDGSLVALKVLARADDDDAERFVREAVVLAGLEHPAIVRYVAHGRTPAGLAWLAMRWLVGEDLAQRLERGGLTLADSVALVARVADALSLAHARGVVHRDVKPSNLWLVDGRIDAVTVLDFGVARLRDAAHRSTRTGIALGTPGYMAPEQARGERSIDARADVFSLGCVFFECVAGRPAFVGEHVMALLAKILVEEPPRLAEVRPDVPAAIDALVAAMMAKDPGARPADAASVIEALRSLGPLDAGAAPATRVDARRALTTGEKRLVCVVLAARAESLEPVGGEAPTLTLDQAGGPLATLQTIATEHGARLERLADGSAVVVAAGLSTATDQAAQSARCALAMKRAVPHAPMALATGRAEIATRLPIGEVIDRAARLLRSRPSSTLASRAVRLDALTAGLLGGGFELATDGDGTWLLGAREATDDARTLLGKPTPCVGRERELAQLHGILDEVVEERVARAVLVVAPAGAGKSRVRHELLRGLRARPAPVDVWIARGDPMRAGSPFGLVAQLLARTIGLDAGQSRSARRAALVARVGRHVPAERQASLVEWLGELLDVPGDAESESLRAARRDPVRLGDHMRRAWEDFVVAECAAHPLLLVLEDLHWGDLPSLRFVDGALRECSELPLMVLGFSRPDVHELFPRLWSERGVQVTTLPELSRRASEKLVHGVLGDALSAERIALLVERAGGNAFFLEELIRAAAEGHGDAAPETVLAMVHARLERLPADARRVLRASSVFGRAFTRAGVVALLGGAAGAAGGGAPVDETLALLVAQETLLRRGATGSGEEQLQFRHALVRDAAYAMLTDDDRVLGHRIAGDWLEASGEREAIVLAEHFERGGEPHRAIAWYARAAVQALEGNDFAGVIARGERGIACGAEGETLGTLQALAIEAHSWRGEHHDIQAIARSALRTLQPGSPNWYAVSGRLAVAQGRIGEVDGVSRTARTMTDAFDAAPPPVEAAGVVANALARVAAQLLFVGRLDTLPQLVERASRLGEGSSDPTTLGWVADARSSLAMMRGDMVECVELMQSAAGHFERAGALREMCLQQGNVGYGYMDVGMFDEAEPALRSAMTTARRLGLILIAAAAQHNLGHVLHQLGRLDEGEALLRASLEVFVAAPDLRMTAATHLYLGEIALDRGDLDGAEATIRQAADTFAPFPANRAVAIATLARIGLRRGDVAGAVSLAREAYAVLEAVGSIEEGEAKVRVVYVEALDAAGDRAAACRVLAAARFTVERHAAKIGDARWRRSYLEGSPDRARILALAREWGVAAGTEAP